LITENRDKLEVIAQGLLEYETLDGSHIQEIMDTGEIQNPPSAPVPPDLPEEPKEEEPAAKEEDSDTEEDFPGELAPA
jgi:cell division protease FtsH